jgi:hypothetical protein
MGRGTRPDATADIYRPRSEFEAEDDSAIYSAPSRPQPKKAKQKQADLEVNEDNYPTL